MTTAPPADIPLASELAEPFVAIVPVNFLAAHNDAQFLVLTTKSLYQFDARSKTLTRLKVTLETTP